MKVVFKLGPCSVLCFGSLVYIYSYSLKKYLLKSNNHLEMALPLKLLSLPDPHIFVLETSLLEPRYKETLPPHHHTHIS